MARVPADTTLGALLARSRASLAAAGIAQAPTEARLLVRAALGLDAVTLLLAPERPVEPAGAERLARLLARRVAGEPVARLLGRQEFWGLPFDLSPATLVPRPDSETVVATALRLAGRAGRALDLGTGSGCLLVSLLHERPGLTGLGVDRSAEAARTARRNAALNGVACRALFAVSDWTAAVGGPFDLVVSNPPYIASDVVLALEPEVRDHDPPLALDGGPDGLAAYRRLVAEVPRVMGEGAIGVFEIGFDQGESVPALARAAGLTVLDVVRDLAGHPRAVAFRK